MTDLTNEGGRIDGLLVRATNIEGAATALTGRVATLEAAPAAPSEVVQLTDVTSAGSGAIITASERTAIGTLQTDVAALQNGGGGGGGLTGDDKATSSGSLTKFELENTGTNGQVEFIMADLDPSGDVQDHQYRFITQSDCIEMYAAFFQNHAQKFESKAFSVGKNSNIIFHGNGANQSTNFNSHNFFVRGTARFAQQVDFNDDIVLTTNKTIRNTAGDDLLASGGPSGPRALFISGHNAHYNVEPYHEVLLWTRHETQNQEGGTTWLNLPATPSDGSDLHFEIHSYQAHPTQDFIGGTIFLTLNNGQSFSSLSYDDPIIRTHGARMSLNETDRSTFTCTLNGQTGVWYVKCICDQRKLHFGQKYIKHFVGTETDYNTVANAFVLPRGYMEYSLSYGDGTTDTTNHQPIYVKAHSTSEVGTRCEILYLKPSAYNNMKMHWVDAANHDLVLPGGTVTGPNGEHQVVQHNNGRKVSRFIKTGAARWTLHRTM